jgi:hypothetical protein
VTRIHLTIEPLPAWLDCAPLLGPAPSGSARAVRIEPLEGETRRIVIETSPGDAADIGARLRGIGIDGSPLHVRAHPPLARNEVRAARLRDARARRELSPGFSRPGASATGEGRYSLTPESLALAIGSRARGARVLDACCGSGGNSIGFARGGAEVEAIDIARERVAEACRNAALYGVAERIRFDVADACNVVRERSADLLFVDPPWGERYDKTCTTVASFPLLAALLALDLSRYGEVWLKVPSSFRVASVPALGVEALFGTARGDATRIKFLLVRCPGSAFRGS